MTTRHDYGCDPYNTVDRRLMALRVVWSFHGPLGGGRAYRDQRRWDFTPGMSSKQKIENYWKQS